MAEAVMEVEETPGVKAVEASVEVTGVAAEGTTGKMPAAEVARAKAASEAATTEVSATTEMSAATEVSATTEMSATTDVSTTTDVSAAVAHADGVRNATGQRERQENREAEGRAGGQRSAKRPELHVPSLVAVWPPVKGRPARALLSPRLRRGR